MIVYISRRDKENIAANMHLKALQDLYGSQNVYIVNLIRKDNIDNGISFGCADKKQWIVRWMQGNTRTVSNKIIKFICGYIKKNHVNVVFSEESDIGNLALAIKKLDENVKIIGFFHDISADLYLDRSKQKAFYGFMYRNFECKVAIKQEALAVKLFDEKWVFNESDAKKMIHYYSVEPERIIPMSMEVPEYTLIETNEKRSKKEILFVCTSYYPNIVGICWFVDNVYFKIRKSYELTVVGRGSESLRKRYPSLNILGGVESLAKYYINTDIVIVPLFNGGGMKMKTLEAISFGKCIVATTEGLNGYWELLPDDVKDHYVYRCEAAEEWIKQLLELENKKIELFNEPVFKCFNNVFSYDVMFDKFKTGLKKYI